MDNQIRDQIFKVLTDASSKPKVRSEMLVAYIQNGHVAESCDALKEYISSAPCDKELAEYLAGLKKGPMTAEYVVEMVEKWGLKYASLTSGKGSVLVPVKAEHFSGKDGLQTGDRVLIPAGGGPIIEKSPANLAIGQVATVASVLSDGKQAIVQCANGGDQVAFVCHGLQGSIQGGMRVIYDDTRNMILMSVPEAEDHGESVLTDLSVIDGIDRSKYGDLGDAAEEILFRAKAFVDHADWVESLDIRKSSSFLFTGPTGTGKSTALKLIASKLADHIEQVTGKRQSRLVMADSSTFFVSYFGETEQRIKHWFRQVRRLAAEKLYDKNGKEVQVPLLVVIEEAEAILRSRGSDDASSHLFDRPLSLILQEASSVAGEIDAPLITIITTNRPGMIDAAALRRFGMRRVNFSTLDRTGVRMMLDRQLTQTVPFANSASREDHIAMIEEYLFGEHPPQPVAEAKVGRERRYISRSELITPAIIEEAVSCVRDITLRESVKAGQMLGIDSTNIVRKLDDHFRNMARTFTPNNLEEYVPHWFDGESSGHVSEVTVCR